MIRDRIEKAYLYYRLSNPIELALRALQSDDLRHAGPGRHELKGSDVYALIQSYNTIPHELGKWEAHRRYIDVQYMVSGVEAIGHADLDSLTVTEPYDADKDVLFLSGRGDVFTISDGMFALFFPHDAHMPKLTIDKPDLVHKIVIKVRVD
jgi:YhcH/YjgK/YiaL family protein